MEAPFNPFDLVGADAIGGISVGARSINAERGVVRIGLLTGTRDLLILRIGTDSRTVHRMPGGGGTNNVMLQLNADICRVRRSVQIDRGGGPRLALHVRKAEALPRETIPIVVRGERRQRNRQQGYDNQGQGHDTCKFLHS